MCEGLSEAFFVQWGITLGRKPLRQLSVRPYLGTDSTNRQGSIVMLWHTSEQPQWLEPCGRVAMPFAGRPADLSAKHNYRGRWRD